MGKAHRILPLLALIGALFAIPASAQQGAANRLYVVIYVDSLPNFAADTAKILQQYATDARKDPGSVRLEVLRDVNRANHFTIVELWESRQAFEAHLAIEHTKQFRQNIQPKLGSPFDERMYNVLQ
jgi:quinol monooxygenase YgiN